VEVGAGFHQRVGEALRSFIEFGKTIRQTRTNHDAFAPLHYHEITPNNFMVGTQVKSIRCGREAGMQGGEYFILPLHVVRPWCDFTERRPSQHQLPHSEAEQIGQVGVPAVELGVGEFASQVRHLLAEIDFQFEPG